MPLLAKVTGIAVLAYAVLVAVMWLIQERFIFYPQAGREIISTPTARGVPYDDIVITTSDGEQLNAWWMRADRPRGAVLLFHGNAGNISHRIEYALMFRRLGYSTMLVDYRGYGRSTGTPTEEGTYIDAGAAWDWLTSTQGVAQRDIVLFGESLGGGVASWLAARHEVRALILASTFTSAVDLGSELYPFLPVRLVSRLRYDTLGRLRDVRAPVLVIHSPDDDIIPFTHGLRLFDAALEPKTMLRIAGGHNAGFVFGRQEWVAQLAEFLESAASALPVSSTSPTPLNRAPDISRP
jgi:fermentation-respiration switch protein FrsA (DUF1100 family)